MYKIYYLVCKMNLSEDIVLIKQTHKSFETGYLHMLDARKTFQKENPNYKILEMFNVDEYLLFKDFETEDTPTIFIRTYGKGCRKDK